jgi:FKBP-type peptidyl-prolyl cis-trans isomerase
VLDTSEADRFIMKKPEINIEVVSLPEDCTRKTRRLDVLSMKYTGYLENGTKFEST